MSFRIENSADVRSIPKVQDDDPDNAKRDARAKGVYIVSVSGDEKGLSAIAKKFNMSLQEFKNMTGLTKDAISKGQVIKNIPHAKMPDGKGLKYLAEQSGMTVTQLMELNGLDKNYKPQRGESFYVYPKKKTSGEDVPAPLKKEDVPTPRPKIDVTPVVTKPEQEKAMKPSEIAESIKKAVAENTAAVGKEDFAKPFSKIKSGNAADVIKEYDKISPDESLINAITSEIRSPKDLRKDAVMTIYDEVAKKAGEKTATAALRQEFKKEMDNEFNKTFGLVNTDKMDEIINKIIGGKTEVNTIKDKGGKKAEGGPTVRLKNGKAMTASELKNDADSVAEKHNRPVSRPMPVVDKNGNITANVEMHNPTGNGPLKGKTIIINAGHGGYNPKNGSFDPGTDAKDKNGKVIEEWYKNKNFTDKIIPKLTAQGAKVIFMSGKAETIIDAKRKYDNADLFISIHCDSSTKSSPNGQNAIYREESQASKKLANIMENNIEKHEWIKKDKCKSKADDRGLGVLKAANKIPSVLIEAGFQSNERDLANIDSETFREEFAKNLTNGVIQYFKKE